MTQDFAYSPEPEVHAVLGRLFGAIGKPVSPYGPEIMTPERCLDLIAQWFGPRAARRCKILITWH